jgi:hypothetical protein
MLSTAKQAKVRINIQFPAEIKDRLSQASSRQGKNVSTLVRESIEEKLIQLDRAVPRGANESCLSGSGRGKHPYL